MTQGKILIGIQVCVERGGVVLNRGVRVGFIEKVALEPRSDGIRKGPHRYLGTRHAERTSSVKTAAEMSLAH